MTIYKLSSREIKNIKKNLNKKRQVLLKNCLIFLKATCSYPFSATNKCPVTTLESQTSRSGIIPVKNQISFASFSISSIVCGYWTILNLFALIFHRKSLLCKKCPIKSWPFGFKTRWASAKKCSKSSICSSKKNAHNKSNDSSSNIVQSCCKSQTTFTPLEGCFAKSFSAQSQATYSSGEIFISCSYILPSHAPKSKTRYPFLSLGTNLLKSKL